MGLGKSCLNRDPPSDGISAHSRNYCCFFSTNLEEYGSLRQKDEVQAREDLNSLKAKLEMEYAGPVDNL